MIITRTPYRISFMGGGSDIASFYEKSYGTVLSAAIQQYMYISVHPSFKSNETRVKYNRTEVVEDINDIEHPIVKAVLQKLNVRGVEITSVGDIPAQTGLGSSSSFTVGLLLAIHTYKGEDVSKEGLAREACEIEIDKDEANEKTDFAHRVAGDKKTITRLSEKMQRLLDSYLDGDVERELYQDKRDLDAKKSLCLEIFGSNL